MKVKASFTMTFKGKIDFDCDKAAAAEAGARRYGAPRDDSDDARALAIENVEDHLRHWLARGTELGVEYADLELEVDEIS